MSQADKADGSSGFPAEGQTQFDPEKEPAQAASPGSSLAGDGQDHAAPAESEPDDAEMGAPSPTPSSSASGEADEAVDPEDLVSPSPEVLSQQVGELTADLQRLQAEYVNYKRRVDRDRQVTLENAKYQLLADLLPVLDDIDRAREHDELNGGFKAVAEALERVIASAGLEKFGQPGDSFDPRIHEALMHRTSPEATAEACESVVQAGYRFKERVMRAARVVVVAPEEDG